MIYTVTFNPSLDYNAGNNLQRHHGASAEKKYKDCSGCNKRFTYKCTQIQTVYDKAE